MKDEKVGLDVGKGKALFATKTLVDQVEERILNYIRSNHLKPGDTLPNETQLSEDMGISRNVTREAMSRLRMLGIIQSRTKRGIVIVEPPLFIGLEKVTNPYLFSDETIHSIMEMRIALEVGIVDFIFDRITDVDIQELHRIVEQGSSFSDNNWPIELEKEFHMRIYQIAGNRFISQFQKIIHIIFEYARSNYDALIRPINDQLNKEGRLVTHQDLFDTLVAGDRQGYTQAIKGHLNLYISLKEKLK
ncbi:FadR/GntR family transcriptional regulator [Membranihabitans marinus]|uniref:FadR/GntR family transcriptional regulator n=1 Tax=Membranihabitans marinus TaxID=1227546 RepID=UPI001F01ECB1|nr:FCD domain-containing protein [Membranihabitans marinus]